MVAVVINPPFAIALQLVALLAVALQLVALLFVARAFASLKHDMMSLNATDVNANLLSFRKRLFDSSYLPEQR